jgi:hypothetical protein
MRNYDFVWNYSKCQKEGVKEGNRMTSKPLRARCSVKSRGLVHHLAKIMHNIRLILIRSSLETILSQDFTPTVKRQVFSDCCLRTSKTPSLPQVLVIACISFSFLLPKLRSLKLLPGEWNGLVHGASTTKYNYFMFGNFARILTSHSVEGLSHPPTEGVLHW